MEGVDTEEVLFECVLDLLYQLVCSGDGDGDTLREFAQAITDAAINLIGSK